MIAILVSFAYTLIKAILYRHLSCFGTVLQFNILFLPGRVSFPPVHVAVALTIVMLGLLSLPGTLKHFFEEASLEELETAHKKMYIIVLQFCIYYYISTLSFKS